MAKKQAGAHVNSSYFFSDQWRMQKFFTPKWVLPTDHLDTFSQKLHENEKKEWPKMGRRWRSCPARALRAEIKLFRISLDLF